MKYARIPLCAAVLFGVPSGGAFSAETITYSYDAKGRLVTVERSGTVNDGVETEYTHDRADNRLNVRVTGSSRSCSSTITGTYSSSSNYNGYTGLSGDGSGMRDAVYTGTGSVHGTAAADTSPWIMLDLGSTKTVGGVTIVPISSSFGGWGAPYLNVASLQRSTDGANWTNVATVSGTADNKRTTIEVNSNARYLRLAKSDVWIGVGDFCVADRSQPSNLITPTGYSASSNYNGYTGLLGNGAGVRDGGYVGLNSVHGTAATDTSPWIMMDLGSAQPVGSVVVVPISSSYGGWGASYLNDAVLQRSNDAVSWTDVTTVSGAADDVETMINLNATTRYLRLTKTQVWLAIGDFYALH